jgi:hypothetical protein
MIRIYRTLSLHRLITLQKLLLETNYELIRTVGDFPN